MTILTSDFDYDLPPGRIAQSPANPHESAKLMVLHKNTGSLEHHHISDLPSFFRNGDIVIVNDTKVFHARLHGTIQGKRIELFLIRPMVDNVWLALGKPGKRITEGSSICIASNFTCTVLEKFSNGTFTVSFALPPNEVIDRANMYGEIPTPPYIKRIPKESDYQTIYAKHVGSVAAPTAGFHLTGQILTKLKEQGVTLLKITLHVGIGTFLPIKTDTLDEHTMHSEWVKISEEVAQTVNQEKAAGRRIIAIGTTTVRTLEGVAAMNNGKLAAYSGDVNVFITPGFTFHVIDGMLTNFHLPKSTLIVLISAFAGRENVLNAYREAVDQHYRFYSFGDAMLIY